jgi:hypothetical protein
MHGTQVAPAVPGDVVGENADALLGELSHVSRKSFAVQTVINGQSSLEVIVIMSEVLANPTAKHESSSGAVYFELETSRSQARRLTTRHPPCLIAVGERLALLNDTMRAASVARSAPMNILDGPAMEVPRGQSSWDKQWLNVVLTFAKDRKCDGLSLVP